tara:strand:+ start:2488 stop:2862 length:375 start_codon:yes stop_codon:yes gene_type:complete
MSIKLKVKSKSLEAEARIIRKEEQKAKKQARWLRKNQQNDDKPFGLFMSLKNHRRWNVRNEARATNLARSYLKHIPYDAVEQGRKEENEYTFKTYIIPRIVSMANKYGPDDVTKENILEWSKLD